MKFYDYHVHTSYSSDCSEKMEEIIKEAIEKNIKEIAFTDHIDYDFPGEYIDFDVNYDEYVEVLSRFKKQYGKEINLKLGVEIGYQDHIEEKIEKLLSKYPFDFVIMSFHTADRKDLVNGDFFEEKTKKEAYRRYFENVLNGVKKYKNYDVIGHLDFIQRYGGYEDKSISYQEYSDIIDEILKQIIKDGKGIEINTSGIRYGLNKTNPGIDIVKRYVELGGEIITIGSDSHQKSDLAFKFEDVYKKLKEVGLKNISVFNKRKVEFVKIEG